MPQNVWRLRLERVYMAVELPHFQFYQIGNETYFQGWQTTSTGGYPYLFKLVLSQWFPDQIPELYVVSPIILWKHGGGTINSLGVSHAFHTLGNGPLGCVRLFHFKQETWDASKTCVGVFTKGILWLEAYHVHRVTGMSIADILNEWRGRQI